MRSHLKAFVGAIRRITSSAPFIRQRTRRVHMASRSILVISSPIADAQTPIAAETQDVEGLGQDQTQINQTTLDGNDKLGEPSDSPGFPHELSPPLSPCSDQSSFDSSRCDSDQDDHDNLDMKDVLQNLHIKGWSNQESRWTTRYQRPSMSALQITIVSWNVDFMASDTAGRVSCVLHYLRNVILGDEPSATAVLLQELDEASFTKILEDEWVRKHFAVTPPNTRRWRSHYGLATLISRPAWIGNVQMLQFGCTTMGRAALLVDVSLHPPSEWPDRPNHVIRIANTHLESLPIGERDRPLQLKAIANMLRQPGVYAGIVGGDMNMIAPADQHIHTAAGLRDAGRDGPESFTWGSQPPSRFPLGRLDRIFYTPTTDLIVKPVKVIGKGLKTKRGHWASDHCGLLTQIYLRHDDIFTTQ